MSNSRSGTMATERPERYAKQLSSHWAPKGTVETEGETTVITFDTGQVVRLTPAEGVLDVVASVPHGDDADRFAQVVKEHLERFGTREELTVVWS